MIPAMMVDGGGMGAFIPFVPYLSIGDTRAAAAKNPQRATREAVMPMVKRATITKGAA